MAVLSPYPLKKNKTNKTKLGEAKGPDGKDMAPLDGTLGPRKAWPRAAFSPDSKEEAPFNTVALSMCEGSQARHLSLSVGTQPFSFQRKMDGGISQGLNQRLGPGSVGGVTLKPGQQVPAGLPCASNMRFHFEVHIEHRQDLEVIHNASPDG